MHVHTTVYPPPPHTLYPQSECELTSGNAVMMAIVHIWIVHVYGPSFDGYVHFNTYPLVSFEDLHGQSKSRGSRERGYVL